MPARRELDFHGNSKASKVSAFVVHGEFWDNVCVIVPLFNLYSSLISELEGDAPTVSLVLPGFALVYEAVSDLALPNMVAVSVRNSLVSIMCTIQSDVHALAVYLDPVIPFSLLNSFSMFFNARTMTSCSVSAFMKTYRFLCMDESAIVHAREELTILMADFLPGFERGPQSQEVSLYPTLFFWGIEGPRIAPYFTPVAKAIFCLFPSAAADERSFKARARVHSKSRNQLGSTNADMQSAIVFNDAQLKRENIALNQ